MCRARLRACRRWSTGSAARWRTRSRSGPSKLKINASIGTAVYPVDSRDAKGLLAVADAAMYAGKTALVRIA